MFPRPNDLNLQLYSCSVIYHHEFCYSSELVKKITIWLFSHFSHCILRWCFFPKLLAHICSYNRANFASWNWVLLLYKPPSPPGIFLGIFSFRSETIFPHSVLDRWHFHDNICLVRVSISDLLCNLCNLRWDIFLCQRRKWDSHALSEQVKQSSFRRVRAIRSRFFFRYYFIVS